MRNNVVVLYFMFYCAKFSAWEAIGRYWEKLSKNHFIEYCPQTLKSLALMVFEKSCHDRHSEKQFDRRRAGNVSLKGLMLYNE